MPDNLNGVKSFYLRLKARVKQINPKYRSWGLKAALAVAALASFALIINWTASFILMGLLIVHEYGHLWAMKRNKVANKGLYFLPFLGCMAVMNEMPSERVVEARVSIMGPAWGAALTALLAALYPLTGLPIFGAIAIVSCILNLFNLLPCSVLDGGRVYKSIAFSINKWLGMAVMALGIIAAWVLITAFLNGWIGWLVLAYLTIVGVRELVYEYRNRQNDFHKPMGVKQMVGYGFAHLGLCLSLLAIMVFSGDEATLTALMNLVQ